MNVVARDSSSHLDFDPVFDSDTFHWYTELMIIHGHVSVPCQRNLPWFIGCVFSFKRKLEPAKIKETLLKWMEEEASDSVGNATTPPQSDKKPRRSTGSAAAASGGASGASTSPASSTGVKGGGRAAARSRGKGNRG